jgi:hypothetical protein
MDSAGHPVFADGAGGDAQYGRLVVAEVGADLAGEQRMLPGEVAGDDQHGFRGVEILEGGELAGLAAQRVEVSVTTSPARW